MVQRGLRYFSGRGWQGTTVAAWLLAWCAGCGSATGDAPAVSPCAEGQEDCLGVCVSLSSDASNCGACGVVCAAGKLCSNAQCVASCATGERQCGQSCVDVGSDPSHCGQCGSSCAAGQMCTKGLCTGGSSQSSGGSSGSGGKANGGGTSSGGTRPSGGQSGSGGGAPLGGSGGTGGVNVPGGSGGQTEPKTGGAGPTGGFGPSGGTGPTGGTDPGGTGGTSGGTGGGSVAANSPSNPNADCAARSLLQYLYDITGNHTLSGQESMYSDGRMGAFPSSRDSYVNQRTSKYPALYSSDFGDFGTTNLRDRQSVVDNAKAYTQNGSIIQLHYHMVQPDQPDGAGFNVMGKFTGNYAPSNIDKMLTPGDSLNTELLRRIDEVAGYLGQLKDAGIAVLWRPYHEMNGGWFWWGMQPRFKELWIQMWDRFTNTHHLDNLLWVFSANHFTQGSGGPADYYPGNEYVDVLGVDIYTEYGHAYDQYCHDELIRLGGGKPIAFTENGLMPDIAALASTQPNWVYWSTWWGFEGSGKGNTDQLYSTVYGAERTLTQDEVAVGGCP